MNLNIYIRELRGSDSERFMHWINDKDLVRLNSSYNPVSESQHREWFATAGLRRDMRIFAIAVDEEGESVAIGSCSLRNIDMIARSAELQIRIGEEAFRGRGLGRRIVEQLLDHGFKDMNLNRIYLEVLATNKRAISLYSKCGFTTEGTKRQAAFREGAYQDILLMAILLSEYESMQLSAC